MIPINIRIQTSAFEVGAEYDRLLLGDSAQSGGIAMFVGRMRRQEHGENLQSMTLEHYPAMTESALAEIARMASQRWTLLSINIVHRIGKILPAEAIVFIGVASAHRAEAFQACEMIIDYLKTRAPFWKKIAGDHGEHWVSAKEGDQQRFDRWQIKTVHER